MKLRYDDGPLSSALVLQRDNHRVELFTLPLEERVWLLIGLAGDPAELPRSSKSQGPYSTRDQAVAAVRAITAALVGFGYLRVDRPPVWAFSAAACGRRVADERARHGVDTHFDPDTDVY